MAFSRLFRGFSWVFHGFSPPFQRFWAGPGSACVREGRRERQKVLVREGQASKVQEGQLPQCSEVLKRERSSNNSNNYRAVWFLIFRTLVGFTNLELRTGVTLAPNPGVTFAPEPKGVTFAPEPHYFQYVTQPLRVKPGDKGTFRGTGEPLGGTWGHMVTCLSIQYVT